MPLLNIVQYFRPPACFWLNLTSDAIPGHVIDEITIMGLVGLTAAGEDEGPSAGLHGSRAGILASAVRKVAMI
jgi:hypothetical protein